MMLILVLTTSIVNAQKTAVADGNWNNPATWLGGVPPSSAPAAPENVIINNGVTVTVNVANAQCASIIINAGASDGGITFMNSSSSLAVTNGVTINASTGNNNDKSIVVGAGTFTCGSLTMQDVTAGNNNTDVLLRVSTGTATVSGDIIMNGGVGDNENLIDITGAGTLNIGGAISQTNGFLDAANTSTVVYNGAAQNVRPNTYGNLSISGTGTKTQTGIIDINTNLTVASGATLDVTGFNFIVDGTTSVTGTLTQSSATGTKTHTGDVIINNGGVWNDAAAAIAISFGGTLQNDGTLNAGTGLHTFSSNGGTFSGANGISIPNITLTGTRTNTGALTASTLTVTSTTLTNNGTITVSTALAGSGTLTQAVNAILNIGGTFTLNNLTATVNPNTVNYTGSGQTVKADETYHHLTLAGSGAKTFGANTTVNGILSIQGTATTAGTTPTYGSAAGVAATLEYKGSGAQTISNVEFTGTGLNPANLRIDNTNGVTLSTAKTINGILTLQNGYLTTTGLLTIGTGGNTSTANGAFVNGPLAKAKNTIALFTFPVGNLTGRLRTIGVTPQSTTAATYTASFLSANPRTVPSGTDLGTIAQISACEYWNLAQSAGTTPARVTVSWPAAANSCGTGSYVGDVSTLIVAHHNGTNWTNEGQSSNTGDPILGGTVTSANYVATFSPFTLGTTDADQNPLPVLFADVKAFEKNNGVQIEWSNLTERDLVNYVVERSANGQNFTTIGQQLPRSNQNDKESYTSFDASPLAGANFYRIKVLEISGKVIYSKILKVVTGRAEQGFTLYPNPVKGNQVTVGINAKQGQYTLTVMNTGGQKVYIQKLIHQGGNLSQAIELPASVKPGVYNMMISGDNYREAKMFIVQ